MSMHRSCSMQSGMFLLQSVVAIALFSVGALAVVTLSANAKRQAAEAHYRTEASVLVAQLTAQMRLGPRDPGALGARYGAQSAGYTSFSTAAAQVLPGVQSHPPVIAINGDSNVTITVRWQAPGETMTHQYVAATRIVE
jgi:type IV pilus assembly protein PilV